VAGCGSSSSSSSAAAITKTAFLTKANAICRKGNAATDKAGAKLTHNSTKAQVAAVVKTSFIPSIQGQITAIRALGAPSGDQAKVTHMLNLAQADLNTVKSDPLNFLNNNTFANFAKIAHPYGLTACASGG
jgi:hypothetical protein